MSNKIQKLICFKNRKPWFLFIPKQDSHTNDCPSSVQIRESLDFDLRENCIKDWMKNELTKSTDVENFSISQSTNKKKLLPK